MKKIVSLFVAALSAFILFSSCGNSSSVDYSLAQRYFVKNSAEGRVPGTISSQALFDEWFGPAPVMGEGGKPTEIDFSSKCVIPIDLGTTDTESEIEVVSVEVPAKGKIVVSYRVKEGEKVSYTMRPCALVVVDKEYAGYDLELRVVE